MKKYKVVVREIWCQTYLVDAENKDEAIDIAAESGDSELFEFSHTMDSSKWDVEEV